MYLSWWSPHPCCWAEAPIKIARMTLTIKLDGNWSSFQLANSALPLSVTSSAIAPSARMPKCDSPGHNFQKFLKTGCSKIKLDFKSHVFFCSLTCVPLLCHMCSAVLSHVFRCSFTCVPLFCHMCVRQVFHRPGRNYWDAKSRKN